MRGYRRGRLRNEANSAVHGLIASSRPIRGRAGRRAVSFAGSIRRVSVLIVDGQSFESPNTAVWIVPSGFGSLDTSEKVITSPNLGIALCAVAGSIAVGKHRRECGAMVPLGQYRNRSSIVSSPER